MNRLGRLAYNTRNRIIFISVFIIGLFVHGSRFFTVYMAHDDITLNGCGASVTSGRWFLYCLHLLERFFLGSHINTKGFIAILSFTLIAIICCIIARDLEIKETKSIILLCAVVVTFPYVTSLFAYTFTAGYYYTSLLMAITAASLIQSVSTFHRYWWRMLLCTILLGLSMAVYQTALCTFIAYLLILAIKKSLRTENEPWKDFMIRCISYLSGCAGGCICYFISNKMVLYITRLEMTSYQGLDSMLDITFPQFLNRLALSYREFFFPSTGNSYSLYYTKPIRNCYYLMLLALGIFAYISIHNAATKTKWNKPLQLMMLYSIVPPAVNSVFLIADTSSTVIYSLMLFSGVMVFIYLIFALEYINWGGVNHQNGKSEFPRICCMAASLLLVYSSIYYGYTANICYTKAAIQQEQAIGYFNRMIARIQSVEGYSASMPVAYINGENKNQENLPLNEFDNLYASGMYNSSSHINQYNWKDYLRLWCGYSPVQIPENELSQLAETEEVQKMPCYPDDGSIKIINGVVVIKFA